MRADYVNIIIIIIQDKVMAASEEGAKAHYVITLITMKGSKVIIMS